MKLQSYTSFFISATTLFFSAFAMAENFKDFAELDLEELLNTTIISASKREQKLSEAPNAISVITVEDIKQSGAVDLPDLFRMVPGMDVVSVYGNAYGVSARGFNERFARRMLVIIDGRSIYTTFFGGVFWENDQVFLEDIERIEIVRGPGATLWGTNAVNGVINIITKDPEAYQGVTLVGKAGNKRFRESVSRYSDNVSDKLSFSITGGYREDEGTRGVNDYHRVPKAAGRLKYEISDRSALHFFAGVNESEIGLDTSLYTSRTDTHVRNNYQMLKWGYTLSDTSQFHLQYHHNYYEIHSDDKSVIIEEGTHDIEFQHYFAVGERHSVLWGMSYCTVEADSHFLKSHTDHEDTISLFLQDEIELFENLKLTAGIAYEKNSFTGGDYSPRGSVIYSPWSNHHFRFSVSKAFQTPSFAKDSFFLAKTLPPPLPQLPFALIRGNEHLDPEEMTAVELGYRTTLFKKVGLNIEGYYNDIDDVVIEHIVDGFRWPVLVSWDNVYNAVAMGVEITVDVPITSCWMLTANYTFQEVENKRGNKDVQGTPKHKFNINSHYSFSNGFSLDMQLHFVDDTKWIGLIEDVKVDDYVRFDIRIAQKLFNDRMELSLIGQNITDKLHPECSDTTATYETERLIYGQITFRFP